MGNVHLVTGYAGQEHVTAADHAAFNAALIGTGQFVLDKGSVFEAQVISNNQIRVLDGELMMQGRFVRLNPDTYVDLNIDNGAQGMKRNDLIVVRYTKDTASGVESADLVVIKGTSVSSGSKPADPAYTEGDITNGASVRNDFPIWRIPLDGLNVGTPEMLFEPFIESLRTLPGIRQQVLNIHAEVDAQLAKQDAEIDEKIAQIESYLKIEKLTDETKAKFGFGTDAVPDDVFDLISGLIASRAQIETGSYVGTGTYGKNNPNSLTFGFVPKVVIINAPTMGETHLIFIQGATRTNADCVGSGYSVVFIEWSENTVFWYNDGDVDRQANCGSITYHYVAIS